MDKNINSNANEIPCMTIEQPCVNTAIAAASKAMVDNTFNILRPFWLYLHIRHNVRNLAYDELSYLNEKFYDKSSDNYKSVAELNSPFEDIGAMGRNLANKGAVAITGARSLQAGEIPPIAGVIVFPVFYASLNPLTRKSLIRKRRHAKK